MAQYRTVNFNEEWMQDLEQWLEKHPEYTKPKQFIQQAVNEKRKEIENQENQQMLELMETLLKETDITREKITRIIKEQKNQD